MSQVKMRKGGDCSRETDSPCEAQGKRGLGAWRGTAQNRSFTGQNFVLLTVVSPVPGTQ